MTHNHPTAHYITDFEFIKQPCTGTSVVKITTLTQFHLTVLTFNFAKFLINVQAQSNAQEMKVEQRLSCIWVTFKTEQIHGKCDDHRNYLCSVLHGKTQQWHKL